MQIARFRLFALPFTFRGGGFTTAYGTRSHLNALLLEAETDSGFTGYGEICQKAGNSPSPMAADRPEIFAGFLTQTLGADPQNLAAARHRLGDLPAEFGNLACAFETACLDILGKTGGQPLYALLGGRLQESIPVYHCISQGSPAAMAEEAARACQGGCGVIQMKVGDKEDPQADVARIAAVLGVLGTGGTLLADANGGWSVASAQAVMTCFDDPRVLWEEPCRSYEENRELARLSRRPVVLDQCISGPEVCARACADGLVAGMGIKMTMQGGVTAARTSRDLCIAHGLKMKVDDSWGADVTSAASLHLALAVPPELLICGVDMRVYFDQRLSAQGPESDGVRFAPNDAAGHGVVPDLSTLDAVAEIG